jgi:dTDP-4-amino-4,6-dideoxygalactose transaminase
MREAGIQTSIHYPPIHRFSAFASNDLSEREDLRFTELICRRELTLPLFPQMTDDQVDSVIEELENSLIAARLQHIGAQVLRA